MNKHKVVRAKSKLFLITVAQFDAIYWLKYLNYHHQQSLMSSRSLMEPETKVYDSRRETIDRVIVTRIRKSFKMIIQSSAGPSLLTMPFKSEPPASHHHKNSNEVHPFCFWNQLRLHFKEHKKVLFARQCRLSHWRWRKCSRSLLLSKVFKWQHESCLMPYRHKKNMQTQFSSIYIEPNPKNNYLKGLYTVR